MKIQNSKFKIINVAKWCFATLPRKIISSLVIAGILLSSAWFLLFKPAPVEASWWDEDWLYRRAVVVTNNTTAETDVYVEITSIDTSDASRVQADCGDLRFTKLDGTQLDYYIVSGCGTSSTTVHVKLDTLQAGAQTIYFYYGNPSIDNGFVGTDFSTVASNYGVGAIGSEERGTGPVLWLKFDEGYGNTAYDSTEQGNNGSISGAFWTENAKFGKALDLDGTDDVVTVTQTAGINLQNKSAYSISTWIYPHSDGENDTGEIIDKGANTYIRVANEGSDGYLDLEAGLDLVYSDATLTIVDAVRVNRWSHVSLVWKQTDGYDDFTIYINGINMGASFGGNGASVDDSGSDLLIGGDSSNNFDGIIDEVIIYPYARSTAQAKRSYNYGAAARIGRDDSWITEGLVGYWKMDEGFGATTYDTSGRGNNGAIINASWTTSGKYGPALSFDGDGDYITVADDDSLDLTDNLTISLWFYSTDPGAGFLLRKEGTGSYGKYSIYRDSLGGYDCILNENVVRSSFGSPSNDNWHHIVCTYNKSDVHSYLNGNFVETNAYSTSIGTSSEPLRFGSGVNDWHFNGQIDDVRIYNRALSEFEVRRIYDWGPPPIAHWTMDEGSGTSANDSSENANTGTLTGDPTWKGSAECKYGNCLNFDGTGDYVDVGTLGAFGTSDAQMEKGVAIALWLKTTNTTDYISPIANNVWSTSVKNFGIDINRGLYGVVSGTIMVRWMMEDNYGSVFYLNNSGINDGNWHSLIVNVKLNTGSVQEIWVDGIKRSITSYKDTWSVFGSWEISPGLGIGASIENGGGIANYFDGSVDNVMIFDRVLTQKQIVEVMMGGRPAITETTNSPGVTMGYWKFDEGYGTTAEDSSGRGNDLTHSAEAYTMSGKFGKAWDGNGTKYLSRADDADFDFSETEDFSISGWFKHSAISATDYIIAKHEAGGGYKIYMDSDGDIAFAIDDDGTWGPEDVIGDDQGRNYDDNSWHYFAAIKRGTSSIRLYVDGTEIDNDTSLTASGTLVNTDLLYVGIDSDGSTGAFDGELDEIKVYRFALSPEEILLDYNKGKAVIMGAVGTESDGTTPSWSQSRAYCPPGFTGTCNPPVGEWKMDEYSGSDVYDTSSNTNNGTITDATWRGAGDCKYGSCLDFDGDGDYVDTNTDIVDGLAKGTISAWIKTTDGNAIIAGECRDHTLTNAGNQFSIRIAEGKLRVHGQNTTPTHAYTTGIVSLDDNEWHFVVGVFNGTHLIGYVDGEEDDTVELTGVIGGNEYYDFIIGDAGIHTYANARFNGLIDDVKIFDYAMTQEQVAWVYNRGKPVGHWKMDEGEGSTAKDSSENNNSGTITDATWTTSGKYNSALSFDGSGDYVSFGDVLSQTNSFTISSWVNLRATFASGWRNVAGKWNDSSGDRQFTLALGAGATWGYGILFVEVGSTVYTVKTTTPQASFVDTWTHIVGVYDAPSGQLLAYVNGNREAVTSSVPTSIDTTTREFQIANHTSNTAYWDGQIDEVKIYNYALTAQQIKLDYNQGSALRFGD